MYLLCCHGDDYGARYVFSASADPEPLRAKAAQLNAAAYEREHAEWVVGGKTGPYPLPLDSPERRGFSTYFVDEVADWPEIDVK